MKTFKEHVCLTINGINTSPEYSTRLVEAKFEMGGCCRKMQSLCLPSINIKLKLPHLGKVVGAFINWGYTLADENLSCDDCGIGGIDFILGTRSGYCLPQSECLFEAEKLSLYSQTPAGVLLHDVIEQILRDLPCLPYVGTWFNGSVRLSDRNLLESMLTARNTCFVSELSVEDSLVPTNFSILDKKGEIVESRLDRAANQILEDNCSRYINLHHSSKEVDVKLIKYGLENMRRNEDDRIIVPLLSNSKVAHLLGTNQRLAMMILRSNLKKL